MSITILQKLKNKLGVKKSTKMVRQRQDLTCDQVAVNLLGLSIIVKRETSLEVPSELSVILPRVEYRHKCTSGDPLLCESEIIYSSLTVVIAPRHPLAGPSPEVWSTGDKKQSK